MMTVDASVSEAGKFGVEVVLKDQFGAEKSLEWEVTISVPEVVEENKNCTDSA